MCIGANKGVSIMSENFLEVHQRQQINLVGSLIINNVRYNVLRQIYQLSCRSSLLRSSDCKEQVKMWCQSQKKIDAYACKRKFPASQKLGFVMIMLVPASNEIFFLLGLLNNFGQSYILLYLVIRIIVHLLIIGTCSSILIE